MDNNLGPYRLYSERLLTTLLSNKPASESLEDYLDGLAIKVAALTLGPSPRSPFRAGARADGQMTARWTLSLPEMPLDDHDDHIADSGELNPTLISSPITAPTSSLLSEIQGQNMSISEFALPGESLNASLQSLLPTQKMLTLESPSPGESLSISPPSPSSCNKEPMLHPKSTKYGKNHSQNEGKVFINHVGPSDKNGHKL